MRRALALFVPLLLAPACIERPWDEPQPRPAVDRAALRDVIVPAPPADFTPVGAVFGGAVELLGYKLEPPQLVPGQRTKLTLYWKCRAELEAWHVFVHLDDAQGSGARLNADHDPALGTYPTDAWRVGEIIADPIQFTAPRTPLLLYLGLYSQGENRLSLDSVGRGKADVNHRLLAGLLPLAK
jgi:hypothetical protein